jgi:hypothetical protein
MLADNVAAELRCHVRRTTEHLRSKKANNLNAGIQRRKTFASPQSATGEEEHGRTLKPTRRKLIFASVTPELQLRRLANRRRRAISRRLQIGSTRGSATGKRRRRIRRRSSPGSSAANGRRSVKSHVILETVLGPYDGGECYSKGEREKNSERNEGEHRRGGVNCRCSLSAAPQSSLRVMPILTLSKQLVPEGRVRSCRKCVSSRGSFISRPTGLTNQRQFRRKRNHVRQKRNHVS